MRKVLFFILILVVTLKLQALSLPSEMKKIENRVIDYSWEEVFSAAVELLIQHSWQFRIMEKTAGFIQTKPYCFEFEGKQYFLYIRMFLRPIDRHRTAVHISWQADNLYLNALRLPVKIGKAQRSIREKINQYFSDLLSILESE
jgi:hypothetical protein